MIPFFGAKSGMLPVLLRVKAKLLGHALLLMASTLSVKASEALFLGTWQLQSPDQGALILLLKKQGLAAYFWGENTDRSVYGGNWSATDTAATIIWQDGSSHVLERTNAGFSAMAKNAGGSELYRSAATQLPREILGQWAKPPTREDAMRSDRDKAKGYFGTWKVGKAGKFIFVESDRSAASTAGDPAGGQRGEWAKQGSELHIIWDSGHYGILRETERGYTYKETAPGVIIEDDASEALPAVRTIESKAPTAWLTGYKAERASDTGGLAFSSRKLARNFYRGNWIVERGEDRFEQIELARFGGLQTSADRSLDGQWTLSGQDVFMRWDDGLRKILSPVGRGFVLYEYKPGRPLDGVPSRVLAAAPADVSKLSEHLRDREDVAAQMQQMADAAGMDPAGQDDAGWGRTFARWAWPFGGEAEARTTEALLAEEFEPEEDRDPWWWPFWSEQPQADSADEAPVSDAAEAAPVPLEMVEVDAMTEDADSDTGARADEPAPKKHRSAADWIWPF